MEAGSQANSGQKGHHQIGNVHTETITSPCVCDSHQPNAFQYGNQLGIIYNNPWMCMPPVENMMLPGTCGPARMVVIGPQLMDSTECDCEESEIHVPHKDAKTHDILTRGKVQ